MHRCFICLPVISSPVCPDTIQLLTLDRLEQKCINPKMFLRPSFGNFSFFLPLSLHSLVCFFYPLFRDPFCLLFLLRRTSLTTGSSWSVVATRADRWTVRWQRSDFGALKELKVSKGIWRLSETSREHSSWSANNNSHLMSIKHFVQVCAHSNFRVEASWS